jgi:HlyD family secretion protein
MKKEIAIAVTFVFLCAESARFACAAAPDSAGGATKKFKALGTIEPAETVVISTPVTGIITELKADYGDKVEANQTLAKVDPTKYQAIVDSAEAALDSAKAGVDLAKAGVANADAQLQRDENLQKTTPGALAADQYDIDKAAVGVAKAHVGVAQASVKEAEAGLKSARIDLSNTTIRSPIKGVVIDRRVNRGQTVTGDVNSSSLFLVGDIDKLQVWVSVNEADIAKIHRQQSVHFKVEAYPGKVFDGTVKQIRLNATMQKDVVTYTVVIAIPKTTDLLPYMTADVEFE